MSVTLDGLQSFVVFSDRLNFTRAAEDLGISQPALHVKIHKLAEGLGTPLYRRVGRRLELTEAGADTARFGRELAERTTDFIRGMQQLPGASPVSLAAGEGTLLYLLDQPIRAFLRAAPAPLRLLTRDAATILDDVRTGRAHLGVAPLDSPVDGLDRRLIARIGHQLVMPRRHPLARRSTVVLQDLRGAALIVPPVDRPLRTTIGRALQGAGVQWLAPVEATGWPLMLHLVSLGLGLAVVNEFCRLPAGLTARPIAGLPSIHYYVLRRSGSRPTTAVTSLEEMLVTGLRRLRSHP